MKYTLFPIAILLLLCLPGLFAQTKNQPMDTVSIGANTHINEAMQILETFTFRDYKKKLINLSSYNGAINIPIHNLQWESALDIILLQNSLIRTDHVGYIAVEDIPRPPEALPPVDPQIIQAKTKQVRIKAVAMLADRSYLKSLGVDWSTVLNGEVTVNAGFSGASQVSSLMNLSGSGSTDIGRYRVDINTLIKTMESNQKGQIIAQPNLLVASGKQGFIQVGQDISIKTADDAGNTTDAFFATGVILDVQPTNIVVDGEELINLKMSIERSSGVPSSVSTIITKSKSTTELVLYHNEETVIGGLFETDETNVRSGIPFFKDLPWWVFGIRYLTGYNSVEKKDRELVITIKAEIVDSALDRLHKSKAEKDSAGVLE